MSKHHGDCCRFFVISAKDIYATTVLCHTVTEVYDAHMVSGALVSTVLMSVLVIAVLGAASRLGAQRTNAAVSDGETSNYDRAVSRGSELLRHPAVWSVTFLGLALGAGAITVAAVGGFDVPAESTGAVFGALLGLVGLLLVGFLFAGAYFGVRERGLGNAHGVAAGLLVAGLAFLLLVVAQLTAGVI